jgi:hypothetical protein
MGIRSSKSMDIVEGGGSSKYRIDDQIPRILDTF